MRGKVGLSEIGERGVSGYKEEEGCLLAAQAEGRQLREAAVQQMAAAWEEDKMLLGRKA